MRKLWLFLGSCLLAWPTWADVTSVREIDQNVKNISDHVRDLLREAKAEIRVDEPAFSASIRDLLERMNLSPAMRKKVAGEIFDYYRNGRDQLSDFVAAATAQDLFRDIIFRAQKDVDVTRVLPTNYQRLRDFKDGQVVFDWLERNGRKIENLDVRVLTLRGLGVAAAAYTPLYEDSDRETPVPRSLTAPTSVGDITVTLPIAIVNYQAFHGAIARYLFGTQNLILIRDTWDQLTPEEFQPLLAHEVQHLYDRATDPFLNSRGYRDREQTYLDRKFREVRDEAKDFAAFRKMKGFDGFRAELGVVARDAYPRLSAVQLDVWLDKLIAQELSKYAENNFPYFHRLIETRGFHAQMRFAGDVKKMSLDQACDADRKSSSQPSTYTLSDGRRVTVEFADYPLHHDFLAGLYASDQPPTNPVYDFYAHLWKHGATLAEIDGLADSLLAHSANVAAVAANVAKIRARTNLRDIKESLRKL